MGSELELLVLILLELVVLSVVARFGREWLYGSIVVNLLLVSTLGAKTISVLGLTTNSGNIFYAAAVFATLLLVEMYDVTSARWSVWFGVFSVAFFIIAAQLVISSPSTAANLEVDGALKSLFAFVPRIALASLAALAISQNVAIAVFASIKKRTGQGGLWMRNLGAVAVSQLIDSVIFFSIAFLGLVSTGSLLQIMITGFAVKVFFGVLSTPFLYSNHNPILDPAVTDRGTP